MNKKKLILMIFNIILIGILVVALATLMALTSGCGGGDAGYGSQATQAGQALTATYGAQQFHIQLTALAEEP
jgi:flagellar basal body-associated protein FliL